MANEEKSKKLRMSHKRFLAITIPILSVVSVLTVVVTVVAGMFERTLDQFLSRGERVITTPKGTENWDLDYYKSKGETEQQAKENAYKVAEEITKEGVILLKNNGVLPLAKQSTVTPFGYRYVNPIYGQLTSSGSGKWTDDPITPQAALEKSFTINDSAVKKMKAAKDPTGLKEAAGTIEAATSGSALGGDNLLYEYPGSIYSDLPSSDSTALVFIGRPGQEGTDKKYDGYEDGTPHCLALTQNEKDTIRAAKKACGKVVLISESANPLELAPVMSGELEVDGIIWASHVAEKGFTQVCDILSGDVNPSGRTVDIFSTDFTKDPSYLNIGKFYYDNDEIRTYPHDEDADSNGDGKVYRRYQEYNESVYMGYRYYETKATLDSSFKYGKLNDKGAIVESGAVAYPFGYGLSYTSFTQKITDFKTTGDEISVTVNVKNIGTKPGKDVVQLYYTSPYTDYDKTNGIEKPTTQLGAFAKTKLLNANEDENITLTIDKEDMASYSYAHVNSDSSKGCYILESGNYTIDLKKNSHDVIESRSFSIDSTSYFEGQNLRKKDKDAQSELDEDGKSLNFPAKDPTGDYTPVSNLFQDSTDYMLRQGNLLSRKAGNLTLPEKPAGTKHADDTTVSLYKGQTGIEWTFDVEKDSELGNVESSKVYKKDMPEYNANQDLSVIDLRGKSYYDSNWDLLLNQIDWSNENNVKSIVNELLGCAYSSPEMKEISLPKMSLQDGVNGVKIPDGTNYNMPASSTFPMMPLVSATWNVDLVKKMGNAIGREGLAHNIQGLYAPAINLHRGPFCGRVFEYFSEDPLLSGQLARYEIEGAADAGMVMYVKHFAGNDQETGRSNLMSVWIDEQTFRELYLKPFEIAVKESKTNIDYIKDENGTHANKTIRACMGVMSAQMNLGAVPGHANYALQTSLLRDEWGFTGTITTDYWFWVNFTGSNEKENKLRDLIFRSGADLYLCMDVSSFLPGATVVDKTSSTAINTYRRCIKNVAYTAANSAAMQGICAGTLISYKMSPWKVVLIIVDVLIGLAVAGGVVWIVLRSLDYKKHPENYKQKQKV